MKKVKGSMRKYLKVIGLIGTILASFSFGMFQGSFVSWFIFYALSPFFLYSLLFTFVPIRIAEVNREVNPSVLQRGDSLKVNVTFRNKTWFPLIFMTVEDLGIEKQKNTFKGHQNQLFFVGWKREFVWTYELTDLNRGRIQFHGIRLTFTDFFGWMIRTKDISENKSVIVLPKITPISYKPLQLEYEQGSVASPFNKVKDTTLVTGVRDYQAGDRFSWIHWKSFAKSETLRTKEFEDRQTQDIFLMIDQSIEKNFEEAVDLTASILQSVVRNRGDISFLSVGDKRQYFPAIKSTSQLEKVMHYLAEIKPDVKQSMNAILTKEVNLVQASTFILVTGEISEGLEEFFINSSRFSKGIICFVISEKIEKQKRKQKNYANVKIIRITKEQSVNAFAEVMKN